MRFSHEIGEWLAEILSLSLSLSLRRATFFLSRFFSPFSRLIDTEPATDFNLLLISFDQLPLSEFRG